MPGLFRVWQRLPRLAFGLASFVVLLLAFMDRKRANELGDLVIPLLLQEDTGLFSGVVVILVFLAGGAIGVFLLDLLASGFGALFGFLSRLPGTERLVRETRLARALEPVETIAMRIFSEQADQILSFYRLKSLATPGHGKDRPTIEQHFEAVGEHLRQVRDPSLLVSLAYYSAVTQDQAKIDQWVFEVRDIYYFLLFVGSLCFFVWRWGFSPSITLSLHLVLAIAGLFAIPVIEERKHRLASLLLAGYCDNFTVAEGATVDDREQSW